MSELSKKIKRILDVFFSEKIIASIFLFLTIFGFYLRFYKLTDQSLWFDELFSVTHSANAASIAELLEGIKWDVHPPGYQIILFYWIKLFGNSDFSVRSLSSFTNIISIIIVTVIYYFRINKNLAMSLGFAASLSACSTLLWYSQEARSYSLMASFGALAIVLSMAYDQSETLYTWFFTSLILFIGSWIHYLGLIWAGSIIIIHFLYNVFKKEKRKSIFWGLTGFIILVSYIPWYLFSLAGHKMVPMKHIPPVGFTFPLTVMLLFFGRGVLTYFPALIFTTISEFSRSPKNLRFLFLTAIITFYFVVLYSLQIFANLPMILDRNIIVVSIAYLFLLFLNSKFSEKWKKTFYILIFFSVIIQLYDFKTYTKKILKKEDYRSIATQVEKIKNDIGINHKFSFVSTHPDHQSHYLPNEKIEKCEANTNFYTINKSKGSYLIYLWGHIDKSFVSSPNQHCLFPEYEIVNETIFYNAGVVLLKKKI
ncbi:dolichyl-phosphate-mannose--protein mannosyltransferase [Leptospira selangorensis]|uniref:Dolichyl-phosphate-mannose--protein mannosyltransferase n=1 Tax=Leptospira selangorensis TaxID=2484982 RepID=A0A5F2BWV1_9LEPT|nr:glycosyltransferase family 39 protein [Leptospira selangorensis]TGM12473.1 dolichyl-phosphate-mannose--protein mannosyltransferase [Leptospira selangorensis]TGM14482.1 dolichyl-phosphate-mannose--protein mannosyltransferase [Leptospira selangorensis]